MNTRELCKDLHICGTCGKECFCNTYKYAGSWRNEAQALARDRAERFSFDECHDFARMSGVYSDLD